MGNPDIETDDRIRKEQFAVLYGSGMPIPDALVAAGYATKSLALGFSLLHDPEVIFLVDQQRQWVAEKLVISKNQILEQLQRDRELAYALSNPAAAIAASSMIAKITGAADPQSRTPSRIVIDWGGTDENGDPLE